jgi:hypothetical protein
MSNDLRIDELYRHEGHFRVIRVEGYLDRNGWLICRDAGGKRCVVWASELVPLSEDEVRRFTPFFHREEM